MDISVCMSTRLDVETLSHMCQQQSTSQQQGSPRYNQTNKTYWSVKKHKQIHLFFQKHQC